MHLTKFIYTYVLLIAFCMLPCLISPGFVGFSAFACAVVIALHAAVNGILISIIGIIIAFMIALFAFNSPIGALIFIALFAPTAIVLGFLLKRKKEFTTVLINTILANLISNLAAFSYTSFLQGKSIADILVNDRFDEIVSGLGELNMDSSQVQIITDMIAKIKPVLVSLLPAMFILESIFFSYILIWFVGKFIKKLELESTIPSFSVLRLGRAMTTIFLIIAVAAVVFRSFSFSYALINIVLIMMTVYAFCGLSMIDYYFRRTGLFLILRVIAYAMIFILATFAGQFLFMLNPIILLALVGIVDSYANFRHI